MKNILEIHNIKNNSIAFCEAEGLAKCFKAYAENCAGDYIVDAGFNPNSGYVYIALEGVSICSMLGRSVEYCVIDFETGTEHFFHDYNEAINFEPNTDSNDSDDDIYTNEPEYPEHDEFRAEQDSDLYHEQ